MLENENYSGFRVTRIRQLKEDAELIELEHLRTGAGVCWLKTPDRNKTFAVTFETVPFDDTGVFHILEHSVLNGSERFPVKDPFVELMKGSLQTFLNAMTFPDKTMYPFSSRNDKDFMNLLAVYMDAVFAPRIYTEPRIFEKEGWHYEAEDPQEVPSYNGVVFNEMKGAFSSMDETVMDTMCRCLFPGSPYRFVSGGDPEKIPDLTYEKFLETHRKFYHPSNSKIWMEGDIDALKVLEFIDREYYSHYEKEECTWSTVSAGEKPVKYLRASHPMNEDPDTAACMAFGKVFADYTDLEKIMAVQLIAAVLTESNDAPFMKMILENRLGIDGEISVMDGIRYPYVIAVIRNMEEKNFAAAKERFFAFAEDIVREGLPHAKIRAQIDRLEFRSREVREPAGLIHAQGAMKSWLYGGDPALYLDGGTVFDNLRSKLDEGYFEKCFEELFRDPESVSVAEIVPSAEMEREIREREENRLKKIHEEMTDAERLETVCKAQKLKEFTDCPDSPEALASLPRLAREDIGEEPLYYFAEEKELSGIPVRCYTEETEGIRYMNMYFDVSDLPVRDLPLLSVMRGMYANLPTARHDLPGLKERIQALTGHFAITTVVSGPDADPGKSKIRLQFSLSYLNRNEKEVLELLKEVLTETVWDADKMRARLEQLSENYKIAFTESADAFAAGRIAAASSSGGRANEELQGLTFYRNLQSFLKDYEGFMNRFREFTEFIRENCFVRRKMSFSVSCREIPAALEPFAESFDSGKPAAEYASYPLLPKMSEGIQIASGVSYFAAGGNLKALGYTYDASLQVAAQILSLGYLWKQIRDLGGAYGTGCSLSGSGNLVVWTYRDPDPGHSYRTVQGCASYLREYKEDILPSIIGTVAAMEPVLSPAQKIVLSDYQAFENITYEKLKEERRRVLGTTREDVKRLGDILRDMTENCAICVFGPADAFPLTPEKNIILQTLGGEAK